MKNSQGYVLVTTLLIIGLAMALLSTVMYRSFVFQDNALLAINRQKAKELALGGIQVAMAQLALIVPEEKEKKEDKSEKDKLTPVQQWILKLLPKINKWQTFTLKENIEGIDGTLEIFISCEQGKININKNLMQSEDKQEGSGDEQKSPQDKAKAGPDAAQKSKTAPEVIEERLVQALGLGILDILKSSKKSLGRSLEDPTELLKNESVVKAFKDKIFVSPVKSDVKTQGKNIYLMDLFTTETQSDKLNPWLLSNSLCVLLGFNTLHGPKDGTDNKEINFKEKIKSLKPFTMWSQQWNNLLASVYGVEYAKIPKPISLLFASKFEATIFSVISYAKVGSILQKVCGIIEKTQNPSGLAPASITFKLKKLYWL